MIKKLKLHFVFLLFIQVGLFFLYGYQKIYDARPSSIHQWRQTDCASFTKNYYEEGMNFFKPTIHWQGNIEGKTISEFPLINYTVACFWKVFGEHEYIYRFLILAIYFVSLLFLFTVVFVVSGSLFYSYFSTSIISTSPLIAYYSFNFLVDVPALSFAIISLSLFFIFIKSKKNNLFVLALFFATLAVLLKASSITVLLIIGIVSLINILQFPKKLVMEQKLFHGNILPLVSFFASALIIYFWYHFAFLYNNENGNGVFLLETLPVWKTKDTLKIVEISRLLYSVQLAMFFNKGVMFMFLIFLAWLLLNYKTITNYLFLSLLISFVSFFGFIVLFFQVFDVHDYYLINSMIFPIVILICLGDYLKNKSFDFKNTKLVTLSILIFFSNALYCSSIIRLRNVNQDKLTKYYPFITVEEKNFSDWFHYNYANTLQPFETITPYLRSLGIKRTDKVISIPDPSFNITLYLMDQKGFTETEKSLNSDSLKVMNDIDLGAKYLILSDTSLLRKTNLKNSLKNCIGQYKNVFIYNLEK